MQIVFAFCVQLTILLVILICKIDFAPGHKINFAATQSGDFVNWRQNMPMPSGAPRDHRLDLRGRKHRQTCHSLLPVVRTRAHVVALTAMRGPCVSPIFALFVHLVKQRHLRQMLAAETTAWAARAPLGASNVLQCEGSRCARCGAQNVSSC